jgi:hypothetical protein
MAGQNEWAPWVMKTRCRLLPYRHTLTVISLVLMVFLVGASIRTEFWVPISDHPRKVQAVALLVGLLAYIFLFPTAGELRELKDRGKPPRD